MRRRRRRLLLLLLLLCCMWSLSLHDFNLWVWCSLRRLPRFIASTYEVLRLRRIEKLFPWLRRLRRMGFGRCSCGHRRPLSRLLWLLARSLLRRSRLWTLRLHSSR